MARLGFIGLGAMGTPMARNLLKAGHAVTVYARRPEAIAQLLDAGAHAAASPAAVASQSDITFTMVTDTRAVEDVLLGTHGVIQGARPGTVAIDHSTIAPEAARYVAGELRARGIEMLDAPVSGGVIAAEAASLSIMVGGDEPEFLRCRPILSSLGKTITYIGPSGAGQVAKACNQVCVIVNQQAAAEAMLMAERSGVDPRRVHDAMMAGFAASRMLEVQAPKMIARQFDGKIESRLHHKDIQIVLQMAAQLGIELPASDAAADVLARLQQQGGATKDSAAIFTVLSNPNPQCLIPNP